MEWSATQKDKVNLCVIKRILNFTSIILSLALQYIRLIKQISSIADLFSFELNTLIVIGLYLLNCGFILLMKKKIEN